MQEFNQEFNTKMQKTVEVVVSDFAAYLRTCFVRSFRRSSVSWGNRSRMTFPSFWGLIPKSEIWMAFSIWPASQWTTRSPSCSLPWRIRKTSIGRLWARTSRFSFQPPSFYPWHPGECFGSRPSRFQRICEPASSDPSGAPP